MSVERLTAASDITDGRVSPRECLSVEFGMHRPRARIADCVPDVMRRPDSLGSSLREVRPRSSRLRPSDAHGTILRDRIQLVLNPTSDHLWTIIPCETFFCPLVNLLRGLEGDRCDQINLFGLQRLINRADSGGFQHLPRLSREPVRDFQPDRIICGGCLIDHASGCLLRPIVKRSGVLVEPCRDHSGFHDWLVSAGDLAHDVIDLLAHIKKLTLIPCAKFCRPAWLSKDLPCTRFRNPHLKLPREALHSLPCARPLRCPHR